MTVKLISLVALVAVVVVVVVVVVIVVVIGEKNYKPGVTQSLPVRTSTVHLLSRLMDEG